MCNFARLSFGLMARCFRSRRRLLLENLALRQQLAVLKRRQARPKLSPLDKLFWVLACRFWTDWKRSLLVVTPETVVRWHRTGFQLLWLAEMSSAENGLILSGPSVNFEPAFFLWIERAYP
jgi:hypothetical protein